MSRKISITRPSHKFVKHLVSLRKDKKYRTEQKKCLVIGNKITSELLKKNQAAALITTEKSPKFQHNNIIIVTKEIMQKITGIKSVENYAAEVTIPSQKKITNEKLFLLLDNINDPGNVGTLIRTAHGLFYDGIIITNNCADPYNDKALRAAKGSTFAINLFFLPPDKISKLISEKNMHCYLADLEGKNFRDVSYKKPSILILSNESHGPSSWVKKNLSTTTKITIPLKKDIDSLNVAISGAILMSHIQSNIEK